VKATLSFTLPDDRVEFEQAAHAGALAGAVSALDNGARNHLEYGHKFHTPDEVLTWVREQIEPEIRSLANGEVLL
jgi:hypothetical protein